MFLGYNCFMNILEEFDTITAPATPIGMGGVGVIRISGEKAFDIINKNKDKSGVSIFFQKIANFFGPAFQLTSEDVSIEYKLIISI